jgi:hypothetical protein
MNVSRTFRSRHRILRVQADVPHTFGTLLIPLALLLVVSGIFLVERTIANPLASDISGILFGSVVLACGLMLVSYLIRAARFSAIARAQEKNAQVERPKPLPVVRRTMPPKEAAPPEPSFHRTYVDDVRISL